MPPQSSRCLPERETGYRVVLAAVQVCLLDLAKVVDRLDEEQKLELELEPGQEWDPYVNPWCWGEHEALLQLHELHFLQYVCEVAPAS